ncbi:MAG: helix-turn-helix domain-containing protein [Methylocystis silviterrae]
MIACDFDAVAECYTADDLRQLTLRDWVHRFNATGPEGLFDN